MTGVTGFFIKLGVRLVVFTAVFWSRPRSTPKIVKIDRKWALPLARAACSRCSTRPSTGLLAPILDLATFGAIGFVMPLVVNLVLLLVTLTAFADQEVARDRGHLRDDVARAVA